MLPLYTKEGLGLHKKTFAFAVFIITRRSWCGEVTDMEPVCIRLRGASRIVWAEQTANWASDLLKHLVELYARWY